MTHVGQLLDWQQGDVAYIPALPTQLVACGTVAETLVDLATDPDAPAQPRPGKPIPEIAGTPQGDHGHSCPARTPSS